MNYLNKHKAKVIMALICTIVLFISYNIGPKSPEVPESKDKADTIKTVVTDAEFKADNQITIDSSGEQAAELQTPGTDDNNAEITPDESAELQSSDPTQKVDNNLYCSLSIRCDTILANMSLLDETKHGLIPRDGIIFESDNVVFYEGESVFNILVREMKKNKIHLEFVNVPLYGSAYIEGIANIYEFDCGELSGWMYSVNDEFPSYGSSKHILKNGDKVEWVYSCDLGNDVEGASSGRNGR